MNRNLSSLSSRGFLIRRATLAEHDKPILHIDMDNCSVDFASGIAALSASEAKAYEGRLDEVPGIFSRMNLMPGFIDSFNALKDIYDIYFYLLLHGIIQVLGTINLRPLKVLLVRMQRKG
ncbi:hypothetical protein I3271_05230 [Photobacterium leiognathi]|uniref:hypothetical protein n=1 Tax=Photobacterium leiognathi TaxID=553611 RepID=UPI001EDDF502|nr:hypothetical protein [Photobacterium leiognathi]MCG3884083.1 hypothetical protein [Photobacterium leiognathi]